MKHKGEKNIQTDGRRNKIAISQAYLFLLNKWLDLGYARIGHVMFNIIISKLAGMALVKVEFEQSWNCGQCMEKANQRDFCQGKWKPKESSGTAKSACVVEPRFWKNKKLKITGNSPLAAHTSTHGAFQCFPSCVKPKIWGKTAKSRPNQRGKCSTQNQKMLGPHTLQSTQTLVCSGWPNWWREPRDRRMSSISSLYLSNMPAGKEMPPRGEGPSGGGK
jgi:hypothetical protein